MHAPRASRRPSPALDLGPVHGGMPASQKGPSCISAYLRIACHGTVNCNCNCNCNRTSIHSPIRHSQAPSQCSGLLVSLVSLLSRPASPARLNPRARPRVAVRARGSVCSGGRWKGVALVSGSDDARAKGNKCHSMGTTGHTGDGRGIPRVKGAEVEAKGIRGDGWSGISMSIIIFNMKNNIKYNIIGGNIILDTVSI
jgi:hypothetical protein